jgi:O-antigen ligase
VRTIAFWFAQILIFMIPWEDSVTLGSLGSLTRVVGLAVAVFWVLTVLAEGRFRKPCFFHVALFLFFLWNVVSAFWSMGIDQTQLRIKTYAQLCVMVLMLWDLYRTSAHLKAGLQAYVLGAWVCIISTTLNYLAGQEAFLYSEGRYSATGINANDLAIILMLGVPAAWYLASSPGGRDGTLHRISRLANYAYVPAAFFAAALTARRTGLFAAVPAILYIIGTATRLKLGARIVILGALIAATLSLLPHIPQSSTGRLETAMTSLSVADLGGRAALWRTAIEAFSTHPLLGVGSGAFPATNRFGAVAHNSFLSVLAESGIVGFSLFALVLAIVVHQATHLTREYSRLWFAALLVWAIGASALTWEHRKPTWLFLSFVVITAGFSFRRVEDQEPAADVGALPIAVPGLSTHQGE